MLRCPACRTRRATYESLQRHILKTGHKQCACGGYLYPHRPGSKCCDQNPMAAYHRAARDGATDDELEEIAMDLIFFGPGKPLLRWPEAP